VGESGSARWREWDRNGCMLRMLSIFLIHLDLAAVKDQIRMSREALLSCLSASSVGWGSTTFHMELIIISRAHKYPSLAIVFGRFD